MLTGDYDRRMRGLFPLFRPIDLLEYDILRAEMVAGCAPGTAWDMATPYIILRAYAAAQGRSIGADWDGQWYPGHIMGYLASAIRIQGSVSHYPTLVVSAYEELINESVPKVFCDPNQPNGSSRGSRPVPRRLRH
jgi:hypothetical protein